MLTKPSELLSIACMLTLRPANQCDAVLLYKWQQDPETRRYARNPAIPTEAEHFAWFAHKLSEPDCVFLFAEFDRETVGMIRLDRRGEEWEVSIVVAPECRGRGIGKAMVSTLKPPGPLVAKVLPENDVSHHLFRSCGWRLCEDGLYRH